MIYDMGERKRKLSEAVLSNHRSKSKSSDDIEDDVGAIGWMLQKALNKTLTLN